MSVQVRAGPPSNRNGGRRRAAIGYRRNTEGSEAMLEHEYRGFFASPAREKKDRREFVSLRLASPAGPDNDENTSIAVLK
jgi:hypothetical protein